MEPQTTPPSTVNSPTDTPPPETVPKRPLKVVVIIGIVVLLVLGSLLWLAMRGGKQEPGGLPPLSGAEKTFYDMLATAATKPTVHLVYAERKFDSQEAQKNGDIASDFYSVGELNNATKDFRAVYAKQTGSSALTYYDVGRCIGGKAYAPTTLLAIRTINLALTTLKQPLTEVSDERKAQSCQLTGDPRAAHLSDGIIPVALTKEQANTWVRHLRQSNFLNVKDKGTVTYQNKTVRKIHLATNSVAGNGSFFESAQAGAGLELVHPESDQPGKNAYQFDDIPGADNIDGYYLLDQKTGLPVYSEFTTASLLKNNAGYVLKQAYDYPAALSIDQTSTINTLE